ncbi:unnamed protein product [Allacma fusca]|uniref:HotDog ACOT-type domain-containing protein n=1 Tax=Allacma fusca TaxID=39272 RepID=A0A8J2KUK3_9HEXA|nr:unnamed protein product [Allacma fusca]
MFLIRNARRLPRICHDAGSIRTLFISPGEEMPTLTMTDLINKFYEILGTSKQFSMTGSDRQKLMDLLPRDRNELPARRMKDSYESAVIPITSNSDLRDRYINSHGTVRIGRLFEDLDIFAGHCCYRHILNPKSQGMPNPYSCVTALVDSIQFKSNTISTAEDIRLSGHVSWVGRSSLEISILVDQKNDKGSWKPITEALFVFVARDPMNQGAAFVNPLVGDTEEEKKFILEGEERNKKRRVTAAESLSNKPPNAEEIEIVHKLFSGLHEHVLGNQAIVLQPGVQRMSDWELNTLLLCHPQYRNRFNKIFGGFIMRQAYEIAHSTVYLYSKAKPKIVHIDDILFRKPVEIGSLIRFNASVGYVENKHIHIPVVAEVLKPETNERSVTNVFQFTFLSQAETPPAVILPESYLEAMRYLDARRHFKESGQLVTKR